MSLVQSLFLLFSIGRDNILLIKWICPGLNIFGNRCFNTLITKLLPRFVDKSMFLMERNIQLRCLDRKKNCPITLRWFRLPFVVPSKSGHCICWAIQNCVSSHIDGLLCEPPQTDCRAYAARPNAAHRRMWRPISNPQERRCRIISEPKLKSKMFCLQLPLRPDIVWTPTTKNIRR